MVLQHRNTFNSFITSRLLFEPAIHEKYSHTSISTRGSRVKKKILTSRRFVNSPYVTPETVYKDSSPLSYRSNIGNPAKTEL